MITVANRTETAARVKYAFDTSKMRIDELCAPERTLHIDSKVLEKAEAREEAPAAAAAAAGDEDDETTTTSGPDAQADQAGAGRAAAADGGHGGPSRASRASRSRT